MAKHKSTSRSRKMLKSRRERDKKKAAEAKAKAPESKEPKATESKEPKATEPKEPKATEPKEPKAPEPTMEDSGFKAPAEIPVTPTTAARKAIRQEQFDFNAPSSWTGGGGYKYEYTPGEGGGSITISGGPSNMKGTTINRSSKFFEPIMEEYYRGDVDIAAQEPMPEPMPEPAPEPEMVPSDKPATLQELQTPVTSSSRALLEDAMTPKEDEPGFRVQVPVTDRAREAAASGLLPESLTEPVPEPVPEPMPEPMPEPTQSTAPQVSEDIALTGDVIRALIDADGRRLATLLQTPNAVKMLAAVAKRTPQVRKTLLTQLPRGYQTQLVAEMAVEE